MSLRGRLTLAATAAVGIAVAVSSAGAYFVVRDQLRGAVDDSLRGRAKAMQRFSARLLPQTIPVPPPSATLGGPAGYAQFVTVGGAVSRPTGADVAIPVGQRTRDVASGSEKAFFTSATIDGTHIRVFTAPLGSGVALQIVRPLDEVDHVLGRLRWILLAVGLSAIGVAAGLGALVSRTVLAPVKRLTETTEAVSRTLDLSQRIGSTGQDEVGRLAASFNRMLGALEGSVGAQRQLVADASHELRTPLTSLRVNIETLLRGDALPADDRKRLGDDVVEQLSEMTSLVDEVVEVARGDEQTMQRERVDLDEIVDECIERARRNSPNVSFTTAIEPCSIEGIPSRLERAIGNLLDNAAKWSPGGGVIEVTLSQGEFVVTDHGPGFAEADLPHVFDRFYRSADARHLPGSGLGLAIVRQVAEQHGGRVEAANASTGGALLRLSLPPATPDVPEPRKLEIS